MKERIKKLASSQMIRGSAILWIGMMGANVSNYLFHLLMGRFLGPVNYGILASIISLMYFISVPTTTIWTTVMKFTAEYDAEDALDKINGMFNRLSKQLSLIGLALFLVLIALSPLISAFLKLPSTWPVLILSAVVLVGYILPINRGILQGLQKFPSLSLNLVLETVLKLGIGIFLVYLGYAVNGAIIGIAVAGFAAYAFSFIPLRGFIHKADTLGVSLKAMLAYSVPVFIVQFCLSAYYSVDILLVKHFLPAVDAGHYSGLSILGKIVFFASLAIVGVMFPIVAGRHKAGDKHSHYLGYSLGLITLVSGFIVAVYFIAPSFIISLLFGQKYLAVVPYVGWFGGAMLLLALSSALANYFLAIQKMGVVPILIVAAIVQVALLTVFHSSLTQIVAIMLGLMATLFVVLGAYYFVSARGAPEPETAEPPLVSLPTEF